MAKKKRKRKTVRRTNQPGGKELRRRVHAFYERVLEICDVIGAREAMEQVPLNERVLMYKIRFQSVKLKPMDGVDFNPELLKSLRTLVNENFLKQKTFTLQNSTVEIPFYDYFTYILTIKGWFQTVEKNCLSNYEELREKLGPLIPKQGGEEDPEEHLRVFLGLLGSSLTREPDRLSYHFEIKLESRLLSEPYVAVHIILKVVRASTKTVKFKEGRREAFLVTGWNKGSLRRVQLNAEDVNGSTLLSGLKFEVYMQKHALNRLNERLDLFEPTELFYHVASSIGEPEIVEDTPNRCLIRYYFYGFLLGYLVVEITDGVAVIRTFLFLTNDDTPEGKNLAKSLGVNKLDKKYTGLDRLSLFVNKEIKEDKLLYDLLTDAGCGSLLNLDDRILQRSRKEDENFDASLIKKYLSLEDA